MQQEETLTQSKRGKVFREIKESDNKLNIVSRNVFIQCKVLCEF